MKKLLLFLLLMSLYKEAFSQGYCYKGFTGYKINMPQHYSYPTYPIYYSSYPTYPYYIPPTFPTYNIWDRATYWTAPPKTQINITIWSW